MLVFVSLPGILNNIRSIPIVFKMLANVSIFRFFSVGKARALFIFSIKSSLIALYLLLEFCTFVVLNNLTFPPLPSSASY